MRDRPGRSLCGTVEAISNTPWMRDTSPAPSPRRLLEAQAASGVKVDPLLAAIIVLVVAGAGLVVGGSLLKRRA